MQQGIAVYLGSRHSTTGALTFVEVQMDDPRGVPGAGFDIPATISPEGGVDGLNFAASVTISPDGRYLYAAGTVGNAVAAFSRNLATGALTFLQVQRDDQGGVDGIAMAASVAVSPDGRHLYATGSADVAVFRVAIADDHESPTAPSVGGSRVPPPVGSLAGLLGIVLVLGGGYLVRRRMVA